MPTQKIVGYAMFQTFSAAGPLKALKMALFQPRKVYNTAQQNMC